MDGNPAGEFIPFLNKIPAIRNMKHATLNCEKMMHQASLTLHKMKCCIVFSYECNVIHLTVSKCKDKIRVQ